MSQQINLFNPIFLKQKKIFAAVAMVRALAVLIVGAALLVAYGTENVATLERRAAEGTNRLNQLQVRMDMVNTQYAPRQRSRELALEVATAEAQLKALREVGGVLQRGDIGNTAGYSAYFKALARQNVAGMWLTGVSIMGAGNEIAVQGRAVDAMLVPDFISRLTREPVMRGKSFESLRIERPVLAATGASASASATAAADAPFIEFNLQSVAAGATGARK